MRIEDDAGCAVIFLPQSRDSISCYHCVYHLVAANGTAIIKQINKTDDIDHYNNTQMI